MIPTGPGNTFRAYEDIALAASRLELSLVHSPENIIEYTNMKRDFTKMYTPFSIGFN